jgi:hypothetical protein
LPNKPGSKIATLQIQDLTNEIYVPKFSRLVTKGSLAYLAKVPSAFSGKIVTQIPGLIGNQPRNTEPANDS